MLAKEIKKLQIEETVQFAIATLPQIHPATLEKFLKLIYTTGTFGAMSQEQVLNKMMHTLKYVPDACPASLRILADLLEIQVSKNFVILYDTLRAVPLSSIIDIAEGAISHKNRQLSG